MSEIYVKQLGEIFQDQFSYLWYCKFKDTCPMLKVCTYRHFRSISTLFSRIIFRRAGVFFLVLPRFCKKNDSAVVHGQWAPLHNAN